MRTLFSMAFVAVMCCVVTAQPVDPPDGVPAVDGVLGLDTEDGTGWLAIRVDFADTHALDGIFWYNNDGLVTFPEVAVGTGYAEGPGSITDATSVADNVTGESDGWSVWDFSQPVAASLGGLYVIMEFPAGSEFTARGTGGGAAVGYCNSLADPSGWISGDGETWHRLTGEFGFAMAPVLIPVSEGMLVKSLGEPGGSGAPDTPTAYSVSVGPNPFNPQVSIRFGLPRAGRTFVNVYDLRGRRVVRLLDEAREAGYHEITWRGDDAAGRRVASGIYFVKLESSGFRHTSRITLVK